MYHYVRERARKDELGMAQCQHCLSMLPSHAAGKNHETIRCVLVVGMSNARHFQTPPAAGKLVPFSVASTTR